MTKLINIIFVIVMMTISAEKIRAATEEDAKEQPVKLTYTQEEIEKSKLEFKNRYNTHLLVKRKAQQEAVKSMLENKDKKKQKEMFDMVLNTLFKTLLTSLNKLSSFKSASSDPETLDPSKNKEILEDMSSVIENTAFAADLTLHFPNRMHKVLNKKQEWKRILETAVQLTIVSNLGDEQTTQAINLMRQELGFIERDPNYVNPYKVDKKYADAEEQPRPKEKKKKEKKKKGPGLSGSRNEL